jgi:arabinose-5-phosphate isomerase
MELIKSIISKEIDALKFLMNSIDSNYIRAVQLIRECSGKIIISGVGKSGIIGKKISSTFSSLGIPSVFIHSGEALHGDLGVINKEDLVILISNSGETNEVCNMIPSLLKLKVYIVAITGNLDSYLAGLSDVVLKLPYSEEADDLNLAPTCSTIATLAIGDSLAVAVSKLNGFRREDFLLRHPSGSLGKRLKGGENG